MNKYNYFYLINYFDFKIHRYANYLKEILKEKKKLIFKDLKNIKEKVLKECKNIFTLITINF